MNKLSISSILITFLFTIFLNTNSYSQAPTIAAGDLYLFAQPAGASALNFDGLYYKQVGLSGVPTATDLIASPSPSNNVFIDMKDLNGHTLIVNIATQVVSNLIITDNHVGTSGILNMANNLTISGNASGTAPSLLCIAPTATIINNGDFVLNSVAGGTISSAVSGSTIAIPNLQINSTDYSNPFILKENLVSTNLIAQSGYFNSNSKNITINNTFRIGIDNNNQSNARVNLDNSYITVNGVLNWSFNHISIPTTTLNYSGSNTTIKILNPPGDNLHIIGGKLNGSGKIENIYNFCDKPLVFYSTNLSGNQIQIDSVTSVNGFSNYNYSGIGFKIGVLQVDKGLMFFTGLSAATTLLNRFELNKLIIGNTCSSNSVLIDGFDNAHIWLNSANTIANVGVKHLQIDNSVLTCTNSTNLGGNSALVNVTSIAAPTVLWWRGSLTSSDWNTASNWCTDAALTTTSTCIPGINTTVHFIDGLAVQSHTVITDGGTYCKDMLWDNINDTYTFKHKYGYLYSGDYSYGYLGNKIYVNGSLKFPLNPSTFLNSGNNSSFEFCGTTSHSITSNGNTFYQSVFIFAPGSYTLTDNFKTIGQVGYMGGTLYIHEGTLNSNSKLIDAARVYVSGLFPKNVNFNNSKIYTRAYPSTVGYNVYLEKNSGVNTTTYSANSNTDWNLSGGGGYNNYLSLIHNEYLGNVISNSTSDANVIYVENGNGNGANPLIFGKVVRKKGDIIFYPFQCGFGTPGPLYIMDSLCYNSSGNIIFIKPNNSTSSYSINVLQKINTPNTCAYNYKLTGINGSSIITPSIGLSSTQTIYNTYIENVQVQGGVANAIESATVGTSSGWTLTAPSPSNFYWIGEGVTSSWNDWMNWRIGVPLSASPTDDYPSNTGHCIPGFGDNVFFHAYSFPTGKDSVTIPTNVSFNDLTCINTGTGAVTSPLKVFKSNANISVYGSLQFCDKMNNTAFAPAIYLYATDAGNVISSRGAIFNSVASVNFMGSGAYKVTDSLIVNAARIGQSKGSLDLSSSPTNTTHIVCYTFNSGSAQTTTLNISGTLIDVRYWGYSYWNFGINTIGLTYIDNYKTYVRCKNGYGAGLPITVGITGDNPINFKGTIHFYNNSYTGFITQATTLGRSKFHKVIIENINAYIGRYDGDVFDSYGTQDTEIDSLTFAPDGGKNLYLATNKTLTINNNFEVSGNYCRKNNIYSYASGVYANLCASSTSLALQSKYINLRDINSITCPNYLSSGTYSAIVNSTDGGHNTGWSFGPTFSPLPGFTTNPILLCNQFPTTITTTGFYSTPATTFSWSSPSTTLTTTQASNDSLPISLAGTYSLAVTYGTGCFFSDVTTYSVNNNLTYTFTPSNVKCNLGSSGSATLNVSNTSSLTNYSWNLTTAGLGTLTTVTNTFVTGLTAGNYTVNIKDPNCARTQTFTITQPTAFTVTPSTNSVSCFGAATGSGTVAVSGATPAYTYSWAPAIASTTNSASGLSSGSIYTVTVKDLNNCITTKTLSVIQPTSAVNSVAVGISSVTCFGASTGSAQVNASGGTPGYTYSWSPSVSSTTNTASALSAGIFTATVKDANGCISTKTISITQPTSAVSVAATTQTNVLCFGGNSGTASLIAAGGTPGYTYSWTPSVPSTTNTASGLGIGNYTATIKDVKGCIRTQTFTITQPPILNAIVTNTSTSNCGVANGSATITTTGGTPSYTYSWSPPAPFPSYTSTSAITNSLPAGNNNLTVTDAHGCTYTLTASITNPTAPSVTVSTNSVLCNGQASGSASVIASGGTPAYSYTWSNSSNSTSVSSLTAGNYSIVVMDASLCQSTQTFVITEPTVLATAISNIINVNCFGGNNGSASVTTAGGTPIYSYNWLPSGGSASTGTNLTQGIYTVTITDNNNCTKTNTVEILGISEDMNISITDTVKPDCGNYTNGSITVGVTGGTPTYTYLWNNGSTTPSNTNITNSTYTVTDANNCSKQLEITLDCFTAFFIPEIFSPNNDGKNDVFEIKGIYQFPNNKLTIFNRWGNLVYQKEKYNNEWDGKPNVNTGTGSNLLPQGTYYVLFDFGDDGKNETYKGYVQLEY